MISAVICAVPLIGCVVGSYIGSMRWLKVKRESLETDKINGNIKILHISDLHSNKTDRMNLNIWNRISELDFDMAAITGDLVQNRVEELNPIRSELKKLAERVPVYFVAGNHEKLITDEIFAELRKLGVITLCNERVSVKIKGNPLDIVGLQDFYKLKANDFQGVNDLFVPDGENFVLVLSHQPQILRYIKNAPDFILSGHTHGGQVRFPFLPALYAPGQGLLPRLDHGWYFEEQTALYISKGIGATNFNIRFYNRPEIAVIELGKRT